MHTSNLDELDCDVEKYTNNFDENQEAQVLVFSRAWLILKVPGPLY